MELPVAHQAEEVIQHRPDVLGLLGGHPLLQPEASQGEILSKVPSTRLRKEGPEETTGKRCFLFEKIKDRH